MFKVAKFLLAIFCFSLFQIIFITSASARSGCCSHHGGVCGCGCCDGTSLSATCAPYYPDCGGGYDYQPVINTAPLAPISNATPTYRQDKNGRVYLFFDWERPDNTQYSIALSKSAGADPGPKTDTLKSEYSFYDLVPGTWYVNVKEDVNGYWSQVTYWKIEIPNNYIYQAISDKPSPAPVIKTAVVPDNTSPASESDKDLWLAAPLTLGGLYLWIKNKNKN
jgi:hypothetical protein